MKNILITGPDGFVGTALCRELLKRGAAFIVIGGFAVRASGLARHTGDVDI